MSNQNASDNAGERIDADNPEELSRWSRELRVDERTLKAAIQQVGPSIGAVRYFLSTSRTQP